MEQRPSNRVASLDGTREIDVRIMFVYKGDIRSEDKQDTSGYASDIYRHNHIDITQLE